MTTAQEAILRLRHPLCHPPPPLPLRKFCRNTRSERLRRIEHSTRCFFPLQSHLEALLTPLLHPAARAPRL